MAITFTKEIATAEQAGVTGTTLAMTVPAAGVAAGSLIVVMGGGFQTITSVADSKSNVYTVDQTAADGTKCGSIASCPNATALVSGDTITVTWTASSTNGCISAFEFAGAATSSVKDQSTSGASAGSAANPVATGTTATLAGTDDLYVMCLGRDGGAAPGVNLTDTTGGLSAGTSVNTSAGTARTIHTRYKIGVGTAGVDYQGSITTARQWGCSVVCYKAAASIFTGGTINAKLLLLGAGT